MTVYRAAMDRDIPELKNLWLSCFEEREDAAALFFQQNSYHAYVCEADGRLAAALYLIDCTLNGDRAHYLCGAATLPAYRKRGLMSALIRFALQDARRRGDRYSLLYPATEALYGFYLNFGYQPTCAQKSAILSADADGSTGGLPDLLALQTDCFQKDFLFWSSDFIRFAASYYGCYGAKTAQSESAFVIYEPDGDFAEVYYAVYREIEALKALLKAEKIERFRLTSPVNCPLTEGEIIRPCGMILPLDGDGAPENVYIGITLA